MAGRFFVIYVVWQCLFYKGIEPLDLFSPDGVIGRFEDERNIVKARIVHH